MNDIVADLYEIYKYIVRGAGSRYMLSDALELVEMFERLGAEAKCGMSSQVDPSADNMRLRINALDDVASRLIDDICLAVRASALSGTNRTRRSR